MVFHTFQNLELFISHFKENRNIDSDCPKYRRIHSPPTGKKSGTLIVTVPSIEEYIPPTGKILNRNTDSDCPKYRRIHSPLTGKKTGTLIVTVQSIEESIVPLQVRQMEIFVVTVPSIDFFILKNMGAAIIDFRVCPPLIKYKNLMFSGFIDTLMYPYCYIIRIKIR